MTMFRAAFANFTAADAAVMEALGVGYESVPSVFEKICRVMSPAQTPALATWTHRSWVGMGAPQLVGEGVAAAETALLQGYAQVYTPATYQQAVSITDELADDTAMNLGGGVGVLTERAVKVGGNYRVWANQQVAAIFNDAFVGATFAGGDAQPLVNAAHPRIDGSGLTLSNRTDGALAQPTLEAAIAQMINTRDDRNVPLGIRPRILMVPPALWAVASRLAGSQYNVAAAGGVTAQAINPAYSQYGLEVVVNEYLTSAASWFLIDPRYNDVRYWQRSAIVVEAPLRTADTRITKYVVNHRATFGFNDWRGVWGSLT